MCFIRHYALECALSDVVMMGEVVKGSSACSNSNNEREMSL